MVAHNYYAQNGEQWASVVWRGSDANLNLNPTSKQYFIELMRRRSVPRIRFFYKIKWIFSWQRGESINLMAWINCNGNIATPRPYRDSNFAIWMEIAWNRVSAIRLAAGLIHPSRFAAPCAPLVCSANRLYTPLTKCGSRACESSEWQMQPGATDAHNPIVIEL